MRVKLRAEYADLRFRHLGNAQFVQHFLDLARAHARDEHLLYRRDERAFTAFAVFDQRRDEVPFARSRNT
jgi:hypothetical protein